MLEKIITLISNNLLTSLGAILAFIKFIIGPKKTKKYSKKLRKKLLASTQKPWYKKIFGIGPILILPPCIVVLCSLSFTLAILNGQNFNMTIAKITLATFCFSAFLYFNYKLYYPTTK